MNRARRRKLALAGMLLTLIWLTAGTCWFVHWQASEGDAGPAGRIWRDAIEAALIVALAFWVLAGIAYGLVVWIVTGRGPRA